jgi:hypothetical protein
MGWHIGERMRILSLYQGHYGERIVEHIKKSAPEDWSINVIVPPRTLPIVIDDPKEFMPSNIPEADLLLALSESRETAQLVPVIAKQAKVKEVIMPIDNSSWLPPGLKNQLQQDLIKIGVTAVFPKTFCTLTENTTGYGNDIESFESQYITSFAEYFGKPKLKLIIDKQGARISDIKVERSAPCGSTHYVAERLIGVPLDRLVPQAGLYAHHYPCLASMQMQPTGETLMLISGYVVNEEIEQRLQLYNKR